jgi:hypothetical protein
MSNPFGGAQAKKDPFGGGGGVQQPAQQVSFDTSKINLTIL